MITESKSFSETKMKGITMFLTIFILINPTIIYLVSDNLLISILFPIISFTLFYLLYRNTKTKPLSVLFFNILLVLSFFLHAEAIFSFNFSDYIIEDLYSVNKKYYFNKPNLEQTFQDKEFLVKYKTNKQGFRIGAEDDSEMEVQNIDWLVLGDSYTQGAQVQYEDLYTSKLYKLFPDKIIVNAGISGWGLPDEYHYYLKDGAKYNPKIVFLQICNFNDFMNVKENRLGFSDYLMHYSNFARFVLYEFKYANPAELPLGRWTEPFYPDEKSNVEFNIFYKESCKRKDEDILNFETFLKNLNKHVKINGAELVVLQIPTKEQVSYKYFEEVITNFKIDVSKLDMYFPNKLVDRICKENNIKHLDLLSDFTDSKQELFYQFDEHLNILGHEQVAISIQTFLLNKMKDHNNSTLLSNFNIGDRYPNFPSTDCNILSFQTLRDGNFELFIGDSLLQLTERLTWNNVDEIHPWLSPDNRKIVFTEGNQNNNKTKIVIINIDGSDRKYITDSNNIFGSIPAFNSDGSKLAYAEWKKVDTSDDLSNPYIVIYDLITNDKKVITSDETEKWRPIFSPDNENVIFISKEINDQFDIVIHNLTTGKQENITNTSFDEWDPAISKDGRLLAYAAKKNNNWDLFVYDLESRSSKQLTESIGNEWDPAFSPCGDYLYYAGTFGLYNGIYRMRLK